MDPEKTMPLPPPYEEFNTFDTHDCFENYQPLVTMASAAPEVIPVVNSTPLPEKKWYECGWTCGAGTAFSAMWGAMTAEFMKWAGNIGIEDPCMQFQKGLLVLFGFSMLCCLACCL